MEAFAGLLFLAGCVAVGLLAKNVLRSDKWWVYVLVSLTGIGMFICLVYIISEIYKRIDNGTLDPDLNTAIGRNWANVAEKRRAAKGQTQNTQNNQPQYTQPQNPQQSGDSGAPTDGTAKRARFCPGCGAEVPEGSVFCPYCGRDLR